MKCIIILKSLENITYSKAIAIFFSAECKDNTYGMECTLVCGNCLNGEQCNHVNGSCPNGCAKGTHGDKCDKGMLIYDK